MKHLKLGTQIGLGFAAVLTLLVVISSVSYFGLGDAVEGFNEYRSLAIESKTAAHLQSEMIRARLRVKDYLQTGSESSARGYKEFYSEINKALEKAREIITEPERAHDLKTIADNVVNYDRAFDRVVDLINQRNSVVNDRLDPNGLKMREAMTSIMESAYRDGDAEAAFRAGELQEAIMLSRLYTNRYLVTNKQEDAERAHKELDKNVTARARALDQVLENPQRRAQFDRFQQALKVYQDGLDSINDIIVKRNKLISDELDRIGPMVTSTAVEIVDSAAARQDQVGPEVRQNNEETITAVVWASSISILLGIALSWFLVRVIKRPLGGEPAEMERVAREIANGNLEVKFDDAEHATGVYAAMRDMAENLRNVVVQVQNATREVAGGSGEIAQGNIDLSQRTEEQASSLEETASSMEELTGTVKQNADNARQANQLANGARGEAEKGGEVVGRAVTAMSEINASSKKIADIIGVIDEIAFQTNLLALNAAVEAARAGEQGRGFAVVAQEVRKLAQRSADSAKEISELIKDSVTKVEDGSRLVDASGEALKEIVVAVKNVTDIVSEIAAASAEQTTGIEQINKAVMQMDEMTQQNAALVEEAAAASKSLEEQAENLNQAISFFKIDNKALAKQSSGRSRGRASSRPAQSSAPRRPAATSGHGPAQHTKPKKLSAPAQSHAAPPARRKASDDDEWEEF